MGAWKRRKHATQVVCIMKSRVARPPSADKRDSETKMPNGSIPDCVFTQTMELEMRTIKREKIPLKENDFRTESF